MVPATYVPLETWNSRMPVKRVMVSVGSLNVTTTGSEEATAVEPFAGTTDTTVGGVVSGAVPVVKDQLVAVVIALPDRSMMPASDAVNEVEGASTAAGVNVAVHVAGS